MAITIPDGVGAVSLAVVGHVRVLLRSDGRYHCTACDFPAHVSAQQMPCSHLTDVSRRGVVTFTLEPAPSTRRYPVFTWRRGGGTTAAPWPPSDDPDHARLVLEGVLADALPRSWRVDPEGAAEACRVVAENIIVNLRYKGYVVMPEWLSKPRPSTPAPSTRGYRAIDLEEE
jgi:hypothetical protein